MEYYLAINTSEMLPLNVHLHVESKKGQHTKQKQTHREKIDGCQMEGC